MVQIKQVCKTCKKVNCICKGTPDKPVCIACKDTGKNTRGFGCFPCILAGRLKPF